MLKTMRSELERMNKSAEMEDAILEATQRAPLRDTIMDTLEGDDGEDVQDDEIEAIIATIPETDDEEVTEAAKATDEKPEAAEGEDEELVEDEDGKPTDVEEGFVGGVITIRDGRSGRRARLSVNTLLERYIPETVES